MRSRSIKPGFFKNEDLAELGPLPMLLYQGLWLLADREGRVEDRPKKIKAEVFPYFKVDVDAALAKLHESRFILRYNVDGLSFIAIPAWHKHQTPHYKELPSIIPPPSGELNRYNYTNISRQQAQRIFDRDKNVCVTCGSTSDLSIDHIISRSKGGDSSDGNLKTLCRRCNSAKGSRDDKPIIVQSSTDDKTTLSPLFLTPCSLTPSSLIADRTHTESSECMPKVEPSKPPIRVSSERWRADEDYVRFTVQYQTTGAALIDDDFSEAYEFCWIKLDWEQKLARVKALDNHLGEYAANPRFVPKPLAFLEKEWKRPVRPPEQKQRSGGQRDIDARSEAIAERRRAEVLELQGETK